MAQYYYAENKERRGPVDEKELKRLFDYGSIDNSTMIWSKELGNWQKYGTVFNAFTAPQVQTSSPAPAPARNYAAIQRTVDEEILAVCPLCNFEVTIFESQLGQEITCPLCKEKVVIKEEKPTLCPFCNQEIARNAEVCRHCHQKIDPTAVAINKYGGLLIQKGFNIKESIVINFKSILQKLPISIKEVLWVILIFIALWKALPLAVKIYQNNLPKPVVFIKDENLLFIVYPIIAVIFLLRKILFAKNKVKNKDAAQAENAPEAAAEAQAVCPHCNTVFTVQAEWQGLESECSECGKTFVIDIKK